MYDIIYDDGFEVLAKHWVGSIERWDEIWFNFDWKLALNPRLGFEVRGSEYWGLPLNTKPTITVFYRIDDAKSQIVVVNIAEF